MSHSPFHAAFTPGTRFAQPSGGPVDVDTRVLGELRVPTGRIVVADPFITDFTGPPASLARPVPIGVFPVELALAHMRDSDDIRVACARVRFAPSDIRAVRWELATFEDQDPVPDDQIAGYGVDAGMGCFFDAAARTPHDDTWLATSERNYVPTWTWLLAEAGPANIVMFSSGWGDGFYASYWGLDEHEKLVELITDFAVLLAPVVERIELPLPLPRGPLVHPQLAAHQVSLRTPFLSRTTAVLAGPGSADLRLSNGAAVDVQWHGSERHCRWQKPPPGVHLIVEFTTGVAPLAES